MRKARGRDVADGSSPGAIRICREGMLVFNHRLVARVSVDTESTIVVHIVVELAVGRHSFLAGSGSAHARKVFDAFLHALPP